MYSLHADRGFLCRVSPFRYLRIIGYVLLPEAFRSLSRLSSALSAKASTLRPYYFNRSRNDRISWFSVSSLMYSVTSAGFVFFSFSYLVINDEIWISLMSWLISISENEFYLNSCMKFSRYMLRTISFYHSRWAWVDSNHRPHAYQACALTTWATRPSLKKLGKNEQKFKAGDENRTRDNSLEGCSFTTKLHPLNGS